MRPLTTPRQPGVAAALVAALLLGTGTPLAKMLPDSVTPWLRAGLLYMGSGVAHAVPPRYPSACGSFAAE